jgi:hypothetical protein
LVEALAPIESVEIQVAESWPPQYFLLVVSGLPNGCAQFGRYEKTQDGDVIRVEIINLERVNTVCTEEYRTVETNIPLGSDFKPGATYTVQVNDVTETFVTQGSASTEVVQFYLILPGDDGVSGPAVGCGDSAIAVGGERSRTGSLPDDMHASLEELFSIQPDTYGQSGTIHALRDADLTVQSVTLGGDVVTVELTGTLPLIGVCADAQMEAQILLTIFQYPGVDCTLINIDGANLKQFFDASGTVGENEPYRRSEFEF